MLTIGCFAVECDCASRRWTMGSSHVERWSILLTRWSIDSRTRAQQVRGNTVGHLAIIALARGCAEARWATHVWWIIREGH